MDDVVAAEPRSAAAVSIESLAPAPGPPDPPTRVTPRQLLAELGHPRRLLALLLHPTARPVRFAFVGALGALTQLVALRVLTLQGIHPLPANTVAFLLAAQVNFSLSQLFTWHDRRPQRWTAPVLAKRWLAFHGAISASALVNLLVFAFARHHMPQMLAAVLGIGLAAGVNFGMHDRITFRHSKPKKPEAEAR